MIKKIISKKILILFLLVFIQHFQVIAENQNPSKWVENISNRALIILGDNSIDEKNKIAKLIRVPKLAEVPYPAIMEPNLVVEYYSR